MNKATLELAKDVNRQINAIITQAIKDGMETVQLPTDTHLLHLLCVGLIGRYLAEIEDTAALCEMDVEKYWEKYCLETEKSDGLCL